MGPDRWDVAAAWMGFPMSRAIDRDSTAGTSFVEPANQAIHLDLAVQNQRARVAAGLDLRHERLDGRFDREGWLRSAGHMNRPRGEGASEMVAILAQARRHGQVQEVNSLVVPTTVGVQDPQQPSHVGCFTVPPGLLEDHGSLRQVGARVAQLGGMEHEIDHSHDDQCHGFGGALASGPRPLKCLLGEDFGLRQTAGLV